MVYLFLGIDMGEAAISSLERDLKRLSAEAGRSLHAVREAADIALEILRQKRGDYVSPGKSLDDVVRPFILACNHTNASVKVVVVALGAIQHLLHADSLDSEERLRVVHVLLMQFQRPKPQQDIQVKIVQTLPLLVMPGKFPVVDSLLFETVGLCCKIYSVDPGLASAALTQIISSLFDQVEQDIGHPLSDLVADQNETSAMRLLEELNCIIATAGIKPNGPRPSIHGMPKTLALELLENILSSHSTLFLLSDTEKTFGNFVVIGVVPVLAKSLVGKSDWRMMVRMLRMVVVIVCKLRSILSTEQTKSFIIILLDMFEDSQDGDDANRPRFVTPLWLRVLTMETLNMLCSDQGLIQYLQELRSCDASFFSRLVTSLCKHVEKHMRRSPHVAQGIDAIAARPTKGLDLLSEDEPPEHVDESLVTLLAAESLASIADSMALTQGLGDGSRLSPVVQIGKVNSRSSLTTSPLLARTASRDMSGARMLPAFQPLQTGNPQILSRRMMVDCWKPMLGALESLLRSCNNENVVQFLLKAYMSMTNSCGILELAEARNAFILSLCRFSLPNWHSSAAVLPNTLRDAATSNELSPKHLQSLKALFNIAHGLGSVLGSAWHIVLETFEQLDHIMYCVAIEKKLTSSGSVHVTGLGPSSSSREIGAQDTSAWHLVDDEMSIVESMLRFLFNSTKFLDDNALLHIQTALTQLSFTALAHLETMQRTANVLPSRGSPIRREGWISSITTSLAEAASATLNAVTQEDSDESDSEMSELGVRLNLDRLASDRSIGSQGRHEEPASARSDVSKNSNSDCLVARATYRNPPFAIEKLVETTKLNTFRISILWEMTQNVLSTIAAKSDPILREYGVTALADLMITGLLFDDNDDVEKKDIASRRRSSVDSLASHYISPRKIQKELVGGFVQLSRSSHFDARELVVHSLCRVIASCGQVLDDGWQIVIEELGVVSGKMGRNGLKFTDESRLEYARKDTYKLVPVAFKAVQLIVDDFLPSVASKQELVVCIRAYADQESHMNISLQAINMLWAMCDQCASDREDANKVVLFIFKNLSQLSLDDRPEVRNCAIRTLCSLIVASSPTLSHESWRYCLHQIVFPLMQDLNKTALDASAEQVHGEVFNRLSTERAIIHHSLDTLEKQWRETVVICIQGAIRVSKAAIQASRTADWAHLAWDKILSFVGNFMQSQSNDQKAAQATLKALRTLASLTNVDGVSADEEMATLWDKLWFTYKSMVSTNLDGVMKGIAFPEVASEMVSSFSDIYHESNVAYLRTPQQIDEVLFVILTLLRGFPTKSSHMRPLERCVIKFLESLGCLPDLSWILLYDAVVAFCTTEFSLAFTEKVQEQFVEQYISFSPSSARCLLFEHTMNNLLRKGQLAPGCLDTIIVVGLRALPSCTYVSSRVEDIWIDMIEVLKLVLQRNDHVKDPVLLLKHVMDESRPLFLADRVPLGVQEVLMELLASESVADIPVTTSPVPTFSSSSTQSRNCLSHLHRLTTNQSEDIFETLDRVLPTLVKAFENMTDEYIQHQNSSSDSDILHILQHVRDLKLNILPPLYNGQIDDRLLRLFSGKCHLLLLFPSLNKLVIVENVTVRLEVQFILNQISSIISSTCN